MYNPFLCVIVKSLSCEPSSPSCQYIEKDLHPFIYCVCVCTCIFTHVKFVEPLVGIGSLHPPFTTWVPGIKLKSSDLVAGSFMHDAIWPEPFLSELSIMWQRVHHLDLNQWLWPVCWFPPVLCGDLYKCVRCGCDRFPVTPVTKRGQLPEGPRVAKNCIQKVSMVVRISGSWATWLGFMP